MAKNRIARHVDPSVTPGWDEGYTEEHLSLYCPRPSDPMAPPEEPIEQKGRKPLWAAVAELRQSEIEHLEKRIEFLEQAALSMRGSIYPIDSLIPSELEIKRTIHAQVTYEDESYLACFVDANINASGESELDAIEMLKARIATTFRNFAENEDRLGREPTRQLAVLREFVRSAQWVDAE